MKGRWPHGHLLLALLPLLLELLGPLLEVLPEVPLLEVLPELVEPSEKGLWNGLLDCGLWEGV